MSKPADTGLHMFRTAKLLFNDAARLVEQAAREAIRSRGRFRWVLSGGSTPRALYELLDRPPRWGRIDWSRTEVFFGDERCVPPGNPESNYGLARRTLLGRVPLPAGSIHRIPGEDPPQQAAELYEREIRASFGKEEARFDLILLGLGTDGHTASLFPSSPALVERERLVVAATAPLPPRDRVTLTLGAINAARLVAFLVTGEEKSHTLAWVIRDKVRGGEKLPAAMVDPEDGRLVWFVDRAAAPFIKRPRKTR